MPLCSFDSVLITPEAQAKLKIIAGDLNKTVGDLVKEKFSGPKNGFDWKKLTGLPIPKNKELSPIYRGKVDDKSRIFIVFVRGEPVIIDADSEHNYDKFKRSGTYIKYFRGNIEVTIQSCEKVELDSKKTLIIPGQIAESKQKFSPKESQLILLDEHQEVTSQTLFNPYTDNGSIFVHGIAGSGKTLLLLLALARTCEFLSQLGSEDDQPRKLLYLTKSKALAEAQKREFARLYPDYVEMVDFLSCDEFLKENIPEIPNLQTQYEYFLKWYETARGVNKDKKINGKTYPDNPQSVYNEFCHLSENYENAEKYQADHDATCRYIRKPSKKDETDANKLEINRDDIIKMYCQYQDYMPATYRIYNPIKLVEQKIKDGGLIHKYHSGVIDEAPLFTRIRCHFVQELCLKAIHYCGDINQGPVTFDLTKHLFVGGNEKRLTEVRLKTNYRSSPEVIKVARYILGLINKIGNYGKAEYEIESGNNVNEGAIKWHITGEEYNVETDFADIAEDIKQNPDLYLVIVPNSGVKEQVLAKFPGIAVMNRHECHGLEFPKVVLYQCLGKKNQKREAAPETSGAGNRAKDKTAISTNFKNLEELREVFLMVTRPTTEICFINVDNKFVQAMLKDLAKEASDSKSSAANKKSKSQDVPSQSKAEFDPSRYLNLAANLAYQKRDFSEQIKLIAQKITESSKEKLSQVEVESLLTALVTNGHVLLNGDLGLCAAVFTGENVLKKIKSFTKFLNGESLNFVDFDDNIIDLDLKIRDQSILSLLIESKDDEIIENQVIERVLKNKKYKGSKKDEHLSLLYDHDLDPENFNLLLHFIPHNLKNLKELTTYLLATAENNLETQNREKIKIILNYLISETIPDSYRNLILPLVDKQIESILENSKKIFLLELLDESQINIIWKLAVRDAVKNDKVISYLIANSIISTDIILGHAPQFSAKEPEKRVYIIKFIKLLLDRYTAELTKHNEFLGYLEKILSQEQKTNARIKILLSVLGLEIKGEDISTDDLIKLLLENGKLNQRNNKESQIVAKIIQDSIGDSKKELPLEHLFLLAEYCGDKRFGSKIKAPSDQICAQILDILIKYQGLITSNTASIFNSLSKSTILSQHLKAKSINQLIDLLSISYQSIKETIINELSEKLTKNPNALHSLAQNYGEKFVKLLTSIPGDNTTKAIIKALQQEASENRANPLHVLAQVNGKEFLGLLTTKLPDDTSIKAAISEALKRQLKNGANPLHPLAQVNGEEFVKLITELPDDALIKETISEALKQKSQDVPNPLHILAENYGEEFVKLITELPDDALIKEAISEALKQQSKNGANILHILAENYGKEFVELITKLPDDASIKEAISEALKQNLEDGGNPLHFLAQFHEKEFLELLTTKLPDDASIKAAISEALNRQSKNGPNPLHRLAQFHWKEFVELITKLPDDASIKEAISEALKQGDSKNGANSLHVLAQANGEGFLELLTTKLPDDALIKEAISEALKQNLRDGGNFLHVLVQFHENKFLELLTTKLPDDDSIKEAISEALKQKLGGSNPLHLLALNHKETFLNLLKAPPADCFKGDIIDALKQEVTNPDKDNPGVSFLDPNTKSQLEELAKDPKHEFINNILKILNKGAEDKIKPSPSPLHAKFDNARAPEIP